MKDPEIILRLKSLQDSSGVITPSEVLLDAEDPESPLHSHFEWVDGIAAGKYRLEQARTLIRSVRLVVTENKHQISAVAYVRDPDCEHKEQGYSSIISLRDDKERAKRALMADLLRSEAALQRSYDVAVSLGLRKDFDKLLAQLRSIKAAA